MFIRKKQLLNLMNSIEHLFTFLQCQNIHGKCFICIFIKNRCNLATKLLLINEYDKVEGYEEFDDLWNEIQLLELNVEKREETRSALQTLDCSIF